MINIFSEYNDLDIPFYLDLSQKLTFLMMSLGGFSASMIQGILGAGPGTFLMAIFVWSVPQCLLDMASVWVGVYDCGELSLLMHSMPFIMNTGQTTLFDGPLCVLRSLNAKYANLPARTCCKAINNIIQQKRLPAVLAYEDIEYMLDEEENLRRPYRQLQFGSKLATFKEYYFYHQDCPRIFLQDIELIYAKWQDRRRSLVYRRLKRLFDEKSGDESQAQDDHSVALPNLLFQISDYNPFSKKYYIRVQDRLKRDWDKKILEREKVKTKDQISRLKHDLSQMLGDIKDLSAISTLDSARIPQHQAYPSKLSKHKLSNSNESIKFNFRRKKEVQNILIRKSKDSLKYASKEKMSKEACQATGQLTPKGLPIPKESIEKLKSNSVFSTTAFRSLNQRQPTEVHPKRQLLKINLESKYARVSSQKSKQKQIFRMDSGEQKIRFRTQSISKLPRRNEEIHFKQGSLKKLKTKPDQFGDFKLNLLQRADNKTGIYQSQQTSHNRLRTNEAPGRNTSKKKASFKIKETQGERKILKL